MALDSVSTASQKHTHTCKHCQVPLKVKCERPQDLFRIAFPHSVQEARAAAQDGCPIFEMLMTFYSCMSLWKLVRPHLLKECDCCKGVSSRLRVVAKILGSHPFQILFPRIIDNSGPELSLRPTMRLDYGDGSYISEFNVYNVYTYAGDHAASLVPSFNTEVDTPSTIKAIREWLQDCHCISKSDAFQPTRVLDIGNEGQDHVTLIETSRMAIPSYACLSYCWGGPQPLVNSILRKPASDEWVIAFQDLPILFKDCIKTLRRLDFQYLWIDSLCIVQDDLDDKEREIKQMPSIYKNSDLTLCASSAQSCNEGFLQPRPDYSEYQLQLSIPNNKVGTIFFDRLHSFSPEVKEPLGTRAWAFQERVLSPRLLEYGWRTARWSCSCTESYSGYQDLPAPTERAKRDSATAPSYSLFSYVNPHEARHIAQRKDQLFQCWKNIVQQYTRRNLTFQDDRLAAIAGMASELQERTGVPYLAGLWEYEELPSLLLWKVRSPLRMFHPRPAMTSRVPSWSWAAVDDAVDFNYSIEVVESFRVLNTDVSGGFGTSASGSIKLEGPVRRGSWWHKYLDFSNYPPDTYWLLSEDSKFYLCPDGGYISRPPDNTTLIKSLDLKFLAVGQDRNSRNIGLMLLKKDEAHYTRVGLFLMLIKDEVSAAGWSVETLCIV